jgi:PAS domain S-box-containing protein
MRTDHRAATNRKRTPRPDQPAWTGMEGLLSEQKVLLQTLIDTLPDVIYVKNQEGQKVICNLADCKASGQQRIEEVIGKTDFELYEPELAAKFWADDQEVLKTGKAVLNREEPGRNARGEIIDVLTTKVPLRDNEGKVIGLIGIGREITALKRAENEMLEQSKKLQITAEMAKVASSTLDPDELLGSMIELMEKAFHFYHVGIYLEDRENKELSLRSAGGHAAAAMVQAQEPIPLESADPLCSAARTHQIHLIPDGDGHTESFHRDLLPDAKAEAIFPLAVGRRVIGVMDVQSTEPADFQNGRIPLLDTLADQIAIGIQNTHLYEQAHQRMRQLEKLSEATAEVMRQLGKYSLKKILTIIARHSAELLEAEVCGVHVVRRKGFLRLTASYGHPEGGFQEGLELPIISGPHTGLTGHIAFEGKLFNEWGDKLTHHFAVKNASTNHVPSGKCHSLLAIPLYKGEGKDKELIGLLRADNKKKDGKSSAKVHFNEADEWILNVLANTIGMVIESAQLVEQIKRSRKAGQEIAKASTVGDLEQTLNSIVRGAQFALGCQIANLYTYDVNANRFLQAVGVGCEPCDLIPPDKITEHSILRKIIRQKEPQYISEDVPGDKFISGQFATRKGVRATLAIKLMYLKRPMGVLFINFCEEHRFTKDEIDAAKQYGRQAAIAIRNSQLYRESHTMFSLLRTMYPTRMASRNLEEILKLVVKSSIELSGITGKRADFGYISLLDGNRLQYKVAWPKRGSTRLQQFIGDIDLDGKKPIGITGRAVKTGWPQRVGNVKIDPDYICIDDKIASELAVPINFEGEVIGVINLESQHPDAFDEYDTYVIENLSAQVAMTIQLARRYEQASHDAAMRRGLLEVGQSILKTQESDVLLEILVDKIRAGLHADIVTLYTLDEEKEPASLKVNIAGQLRPTTDPRKITAESVVWEIIKNRQPIFADDTLYNRSLTIGDFVSREKIRSSAGIPLMAGEAPVGVLFVNYRTPHIFTKQQQEDMELFATQAAQAIRNVHDFENLKQHKSLVGSRTALAFMGMANSVWGHSIEGHVINIRNQATLMRLDLQESGIPPEALEKLTARVDLIEAQAAEALEREHIPSLAEENARIMPLDEMIRERVGQLRAQGDYKEVAFRLNLKADVLVKVAPEWFRSAFDMLVDNAMQAMQDSADKKISINASASQDKVRVSVTDKGPGIPAEIKPYILKKQIVSNEQKGLGVGLLLAQAILEAYKGDIRLKKTGPDGTTFEIILPIHKTN